MALAFASPAHIARAQDKVDQPPPPAAEAPAPAAADEIDALVVRVALYPDALLALVLQASTLPVEIVQATRFLEKRAKDPSLKPDPGWDTSTVGLLNYPTVLRMMNDDLDWTEALGAAVVDRLPDVQASVQQIRAEMQAAGALESNDKQKVIIDQDTIKIEPATRDVIYVPIYQPVPEPAVEAAAAPPAPEPRRDGGGGGGRGGPCAQHRSPRRRPRPTLPRPRRPRRTPARPPPIRRPPPTLRPRGARGLRPRARQLLGALPVVLDARRVLRRRRRRRRGAGLRPRQQQRRQRR